VLNVIVFGGTEVLSAARMPARIGGLPGFYTGSPSARFDRMERRDAGLVEHCFKVGAVSRPGSPRHSDTAGWRIVENQSIILPFGLIEVQACPRA